MCDLPTVTVADDLDLTTDLLPRKPQNGGPFSCLKDTGFKEDVEKGKNLNILSCAGRGDYDFSPESVGSGYSPGGVGRASPAPPPPPRHKSRFAVVLGGGGSEPVGSPQYQRLSTESHSPALRPKRLKGVQRKVTHAEPEDTDHENEGKAEKR